MADMALNIFILTFKADENVVVNENCGIIRH